MGWKMLRVGRVPGRSSCHWQRWGENTSSSPAARVPRGLATPPHPWSSLGALMRWGRGLSLALLGETESRGKLPPSQPWSSFLSRCAQTPTPLQLSY